MKEDKLSALSMQLSVDILALVKELREQKSPIKSAEARRAFAPTLPKVSTATAALILLRNWKSR